MSKKRERYETRARGKSTAPNSSGGLWRAGRRGRDRFEPRPQGHGLCIGALGLGRPGRSGLCLCVARGPRRPRSPRRMVFRRIRRQSMQMLRATEQIENQMRELELNPDTVQVVESVQRTESLISDPANACSSEATLTLPV